jgi:cellulose synthase (UDP-forming)
MGNMNKPILVDILNQKQKRQLNILMSIWLATTAAFFIYWCWPRHIINWETFVFNTIVISFPLLMPGYAFFFVRRMKKPNLALGVPKEWRVAQIVTKAPSEPWTVVKRTLTGMLADTSVAHDTWLADEDPSEETKAWCAAHGVQISCRKGVPGYHNDDYPRRKKCKEGNLAYFYDNWGYANYDFVVQHDADHMPLPGYLAAMLPAFHDPKIGYVSAPSICDHNGKYSWICRARLWAESILQGTMQSGSWGDFTTMCIGSHFAIRTIALKQVGGLGPELSEDHSTTFLLCAAGWQGVHAIDAIASGRGPETFKDAMTQELQWSRSLIVLFLTLTPKHIAKMPLKMAGQFLFCQLWYIFYAFSLLGAFMISPIALLSGHSFMNVNFWVWFVVYTIPTLTCIEIVRWLRRNELLRPYDAKVVSWELLLFPLGRWPIVMWAIVDAFRLTYVSKKRVWKVTPKKKESSKLPAWMMWAYLSLIGISALIAIFVRPNAQTLYYYYFNLMNGTMYVILLTVVAVQDRRESKRRALDGL